MSFIARPSRVIRFGLAWFVVLGLLFGLGANAAAQDRRRDRDLFDSEELAVAVAEHMQEFWDDIFIRSDLPYETPIAVLFDSLDRGSTGCGRVETYDYSWYCIADDTVYINIDHVEQLRDDESDLYAAVVGVGQPMSLAVLDRVGGLALDRTGGADRFSVEAAACLTGVWTAELWYEDIVVTDDVLDVAEGLEDLARYLPDAYLFGYDEEDPQLCLDVMLPS